MMKSKLSIDPEVKAKYYKGWQNKFIRVYFYLQEGLGLVNNFKYLIAGILAFYYVIKSDSILLLVSMFVVSIPILVILGYIWIHRAKKSIEWFSIEFTTVFGKYGYELQEETNKLLNEINDKLNENKISGTTNV